ncbi:MAG: GAF domain-containing protein, partial [Deltaproteobacteria bacterium]|nr:GAF domain-containing protein [Deltaproteobacteria bacterium]
MTVIATMYLYNITRWANYPDFGFGWRAATGIDVVGTITDNGRKAGLRLGDHFIEVNGNTFTNTQEFRSHMRRELGDENYYLIERAGRTSVVTITNIPTGFKGAFRKSGFPYLVGICYIVIGTIVFLMKPHARSSWIFFLFGTTFGLFLIFLLKVGIMKPRWLETVDIFAWVFVPGVFIHLAFCFPQERKLVVKYSYLQAIPYFISALLFLRIRSLPPTMTHVPKFWLLIMVSYMTCGVLFFLGSCLQLRFTSSSEIIKLRSRMILLGFAISASLPLMDLIINTIFGVYIVPSFNYYLSFFIVFPLSVGYSIVRHDLFDFDTIIKRTYGYVLTTGAIAGAYGLFVLVSDVAFGRFEITQSPMFPLVFILGVVFLFNPIRNRAQKFIDRVFYRLEYDYQETVHKISETMRSLLKLDEIGKRIMDIVIGPLFVDAGGVLLLNRENEFYECLISSGKREIKQRRNDSDIGKPELIDKTLPQAIEPKATESEIAGLNLSKLRLSVDEPFIQKIMQRKKEITIYDIQEDPFFEDQRASYKEMFEQLQATLIVPLIYEDKLTGLISLGEKKSGKFYRREDINLLNTLANQGAVAIENARMIEEVIEKERMEEELSIARDLQTSMLPAECPIIKGFEIAAYSL